MPFNTVLLGKTILILSNVINSTVNNLILWTLPSIPFIDTSKIDTEKVNEKLNNLPIIGLVAIISFFVFAPLSLVISLIGLFSKNKNSKTICKIIFIFDIVVLAFIIGIIILISRYDSNHSSYIGNIYGM